MTVHGNKVTDLTTVNFLELFRTFGEEEAKPRGKEHEMHHRAQLTVMERMIGVVPHLTRQRQERMAQAASRATQDAPHASR